MKLGIKRLFYTSPNNLRLPFAPSLSELREPKEIDWTEIPLVHLSGTLSDQSEHEKDGLLHTVSITAVAKEISKRSELRNLLKKLASGNYLYKVSDMNGNHYLIGTPHFRAQLDYKLEIGKLDKNNFALEIHHRSPHGCLLLLNIPENTPSKYVFTWLNANGDTIRSSIEKHLYPDYQKTFTEIINSYDTSSFVTLEDGTKLYKWLSHALNDLPSWMTPSRSKNGLSLTIKSNYNRKRYFKVELTQNESGKKLYWEVTQEGDNGNLIFGLSAEDKENLVYTAKIYSKDGLLKTFENVVYTERYESYHSYASIEKGTMVRVEFSDIRIDGKLAVLGEGECKHPSEGTVVSSGLGFLTIEGTMSDDANTYLSAFVKP